MPLALRLAVLALVVGVAVVWAIRSTRSEGPEMRTLLLTGFGPFEGFPVNPSWEAVRALEGERIGDTLVRTARLDVTYADAPAQLREAITRTAPDAVVCFGVAPGTDLRLEVVARNRDTAPVPDVSGVMRAGRPIRADGPDLLPSTLPVARLLEALRGAGYEVATSEDAGGYLCNHVFYRLMDAGEDLGPSGFIHVPPLEEPWTLERLRDAVRLIVETLESARDGA